jgi:hypothetical protein
MKLLIILYLSVGISSSFAGKMPAFALHPSAKDEYKGALQLIADYGNSDEFYKYVSKKRRYFSHTNLSVAGALSLFRQQLNKGGVISIEFGDTFWRKDILGVWNGYEIKDNINFKMTETERAGHLMHETSHRYGWKHKGNLINTFDNINSFPYAIGNDFQDFLESQLVQSNAKRKSKPHTVRDIFVSNLSKFRYCYQKEIESSDLTLEGRALIKFTLAASGKLINGKILGTSDITNEMKRCMAQVLSTIKFPKQNNKQTSTHSQKMKFYANN